ncbi:zinc finger protein VAR3, chloroplastic-like isoform X2 [Salvia miltiorrhiza]|uniref:zinc finger protein VAR3, chloroplastic-like isoform X2 n=1 Tax=Salvia miltiorrhiza TaxID=226208 RepID=UPI0025AD0050|nr:zinc finger protein VAR3, chloroplastic-like isoform X2 [Salvia miltiorrhiza]XP_057767330.1 zinc finger protein VAR3, chloroplastic-like isoform X2 [Salvia miltiorrhiza]
MGGATRFMTLLTAPFPPLRPSLILLHRRLSSLSIAPLRLHTRSPLSKSKTLTPQPPSCFHSQPSNNTYALQSSAAQQHLHHPWPEWINFLNFLSNGQGYSAPHGDKIPPEDAFVVYEKLSDDFVSAAAACIAFSRARPDLIGRLSRKDIEAVVSNGTPFLFKSALDTARRMRAFLGTAGSNVAEVDKARLTDLMKYIISYASNPTASSERNGLYSRELVDSSVRNLLHEMVTVCGGAPTGYMPASGHQFSGSDRHVPNPNGQNIEMKRGDWICQKCDFMNFAKNVKCLECEEPRPKRQLIGGEWECPECSFYNYGRNTVCLRCDCRRPGAPLFNNNNSQKIGTQFSPLSQSGSSDIRYSGSNHAKAVPFVPLPADTFSRRYQTPEMDNGNKIPVEANNTASSDVRNRTAISSTPQGLSGNTQLTRDSASQIDIQNNEGEQTEKAERWFKRMAELQNAKDLPNAVSDEDFPEIMPVRKGENRFVVSKKKDRSLTSPQYKRQVAMDQANNTNFVPFVPFPPGYFANKGTEQPGGPDSPANTVSDTSFSKAREHTDKFDAKHGMADSSTVWRNDQNARSSGDSLYTNETSTAQFGGDYSKQYSGGTVQNSFASDTMNTNRQTGGYSGAGDASVAGHGGALSSETGAAQFGGNASIAGHGGASSQPPKNENVRTSWSGPSLEGSAVKEPDPLDMSEEAKTERWFKRVAQIKDISELSQIPDEDFPSIMPMRKGVNRFVVSKRKTPLERRLTNQQYRRNLPIVPNNPLKKEGDSS